ncbi:hypothetical protein [Enterobacter roggenkampii]|uniref:hypothetical protein n=1 Tax=Enterobacter roggenkampii TaxID=1812935 RepID=UPI00292BC109|nr:hypothetical protein [Enterobacter roggenkampii]MDV0448910.1 hypothetical protein [Enterobacter roggenkampii]MDV0462947.1 hypothetical protein [Enterobacter roggenkampii]MDV0467781.1 hypothetical protein [Enterobacter roggenkampii]MDV0532766.1 hypothetical protein [Enterobacter roggenkampii]MDV1255845.1 hypothetical protein [Enterobacter roggenkampii]
MTDLQNNKEMIAVGHEFARTLSSDTPIIEIAKMITRLAGRLDCVTLALREMTKQRDAADQAERVWERTMMDACGEDGPKSVADKFAELKAQCAALAAELSAFERICNEAVFITDEHYEKCPPEVQKMIRSLAVMQIPAYQAFLAEVRASAVDDVCLKISNAIINCYQDEQIGLDAAATICGDFTAQLRKGVQS